MPKMHNLIAFEIDKLSKECEKQDSGNVQI